jgi:MFS superfamily sulfate permease-like transporter
MLPLHDFLSQFTVSIISSVTSGSVGQSIAGELIGAAAVSSQSAGLTNVTYNFSYSVPDSTPEPAAVVIMVVGLLCLAVGRLRTHLS